MESWQERDDAARLLRRARRRQRQIERFVVARLFPHAGNRSVRATRHFREWWRLPMNYARLMELPLTYEMLGLTPGHSVLDVSSPKLLALYIAWADRCRVLATDLDEYFVDDFRTFNTVFGTSIGIQVFDAQNMPIPDASFDRAYSVSVLEHIPGDGDGKALQEIARVLKPGGRCVITLPAFPTYLEEWLSNQNFYWRSAAREDGAVFYQHRYDEQALRQRLEVPGLEVERIVLVAERPIEQPRLRDDGLLLHNSYYLAGLRLSKFGRRLSDLKLPLGHYLGERWASGRYHYLRKSWQDPNVRQVLVQFRKTPEASAADRSEARV